MGAKSVCLSCFLSLNSLYPPHSSHLAEAFLALASDITLTGLQAVERSTLGFRDSSFAGCQRKRAGATQKREVCGGSQREGHSPP